jgi:1-acyl-sn-glycerol-3-phosphate acyltransferase
MIARFLRSSYRIPGFLLMSLGYVAVLALVHIRYGNDRNRLHRLLLHYIRNVYRLMGIRVFVEGELPDEPSILMGNHRSYVDAVMVPAKNPVAFVGRIESKSWPIIGWGATLLGTIWVDRSSKESRKHTRDQVKQRLQDGFGIVIFPEGTTHKGPELLEYRPSMFYISAEGGFPVTPIAIEYKDPNIAWVGQSKFVPHAWKHFGAKTIDVKVSYGPTQCLSDGGAMLELTRAWTEREVLRLRREWDEQIKAETK